MTPAWHVYLALGGGPGSLHARALDAAPNLTGEALREIVARRYPLGVPGARTGDRIALDAVDWDSLAAEINAEVGA